MSRRGLPDRASFARPLERTWTPEARREHSTGEITAWLTGFAPGLVPELSDPGADDPPAAGRMRRVARDVPNPVSRSVRSNGTSDVWTGPRWPAAGGSDDLDTGSVASPPGLPSDGSWRCPVAGSCAETSPSRFAMEDRDEP
jgi:hypothetical protein